MEIIKFTGSTSQRIFTPENLDLLTNLKTKRISLKETYIPPRIFNYWKKSGLIPVEDKIASKRKWERLSYVEYIWLKCVEEMREFGIPFEKIHQAKEELFEPFDIKKIKEIKAQLEQKKKNPIKETISKMIEEIHSYDIPPEEKEQIISSLQYTDDIMENIIKRFNYNLFDFLILHSIMFKKDFGFFITKDRVYPITYNDFEKRYFKKLKEVLIESHVYISITKLYSQFLNDEDKQQYFSNFPLLNEDEYAIFTFMKKENFHEIKIKKDSKNTIITGKMKFPYNLKEYSSWKKKTKLSYPFCEINEKQHEGKITSIEFTVKEIIPK